VHWRTLYKSSQRASRAKTARTARTDRRSARRGAFAFVSGVATTSEAFGVPIRRRRAWLVVEGLLGIAVGVVVFVWPDLPALGLLYAIAASAIAVAIFADPPRVRPAAEPREVAARRAGRACSERVRRDHVRPSWCRRSRATGADRSVRVRDGRHAQRVRARTAARRRRVGASRPAARDGEAAAQA
jgi:hypothetical protein